MKITYTIKCKTGESIHFTFNNITDCLDAYSEHTKFQYKHIVKQLTFAVYSIDNRCKAILPQLTPKGRKLYHDENDLDRALTAIINR